jgi:hypothetical protein
MAAGVRHLHETSVSSAGRARGTEAVITYPASQARRGVVLLPPHPLLGGDMENNVIVALARGLPAEGLAALRFNYATPEGRPRYEHWRGVEERGDYGDAVLDARAALALAARVFEPRALVGVSFGAAVAARLAAEDGLTVPLVLICPPFARLDPSLLADRDAPTQIVLAAGDSLGGAPPALDRLAGAEVHVIPGTDHFFVGHERRVTAVVARFLRGLASKGERA